MKLAIKPKIAAFWLKIILLTGGAVAVWITSPEESLNLTLLRVSSIFLGLVMLISLMGYPAKQTSPLETHEDLYLMADAPGGLSLFSGPTDSGKSSSLTSMIHHMPRNMRKIEIADPVEIYTKYATHHLDISQDEEAL